MSAEILATLKRIEAKLDAVLAKRQQEERSRPAKQTENVAGDSDLDGKYGNPLVRFSPRDWSGAPYKGCRYSDTEPEFLDMLANTLEYFADKKANDDPTKSGYDRKDAARARGWAKRLRDGWEPESEGDASEEPAQRSYDFDDSGKDDIPF